MRRTLRLWLVLALAAAPVLGAVVAPVAIPAGAVSFGIAGVHVAQAADSISLRGDAAMLASLASLRQELPAIQDPARRAAAAAVLGALASDPAALPQRLAATDLPPAAVDQILRVSHHLDAAARKSPELAAQVAAGRESSAALAADAAKTLPTDLAATYRAFLDWSRAPVLDAAPAVASVAADAPPAPQARPQVSFGSAKLPMIAQPTLGDDIASLWKSAHDQSASALVVAYNFDDMDIAQAIVDGAKAGKKYVFVGDYSNWFPERMPQRKPSPGHQPKIPQKTPAMELILANLGPNLQLSILKGLGAIGINHNKFTVFTAGDGAELLQAGSFNYTKTSQLNHWENVVFTDDADRIAFYKDYHAWLVRRARPYSPDLMPEAPTLPEDDPIPQLPASDQLVFHDVPFPKASASPKGGTEDWLVKAEQLVHKSLDILMFAPFPTPAMAEQIQNLLAAGIPVRLIADHGEVGGASKILQPLVEKGLQLKSIAGPDVVVDHKPWSEASKMHEKVMIFDGAEPDALAKMGDSLNISLNALNNNFETTQFWQGFHASFMQSHFNALWDLALTVDHALIAKLAAEHPGGAPGA